MTSKGTPHRPNRSNRARRATKKAGLAPGTPLYTGDATDVKVKADLFDYSIDELVEKTDVPWQEISVVRDTKTITWVDITGLHDTKALLDVAQHFGLHGLALEDLLSTDTRPKVEDIAGHTLVVMKMIDLDAQGDVTVEHVGFVRGPTWVLTFQERPGDVFGAVRSRIRNPEARIRRKGSDYLLHALMDAVIDGYFRALESFERIADELEAEALDKAGTDFAWRAHHKKAELRRLRRSLLPLKTGLHALSNEHHPAISGEVQPYFRDLNENGGLVIDIADANIDRLTSVMELHLAMVSNRMNEVMRVLTIVTTIFVPMTFMAGIYGMNFEWMPELKFAWGYPIALSVMAVTGLSMLGWLRQQDWL